MDKLEKKIKELKEIDFPSNLHGRIMMALFKNDIKSPALAISAVLIFNLLISSWNIWHRIIERDTLSGLGDILDGFEATPSFLSTFLGTAASSLPTVSIVIFLTNFFLLTFLIRFFLDWKLKKVE